MLRGRIIIVALCTAPVMLAILSGQGCPPVPPGDDGDGTGNPTPQVNNPPVANAMANPASAELGASVELDARSSSDPDGDALSCLWTQVDGPQASLSDAGTALAWFIPPQPGVYDFAVTVSDGRSGLDEATVRVSVRDPICHSYPVARARAERTTVCGGDHVKLSGTTSEDPCGNNVGYDWRKTGGIPVDLLDANTATPSFTAPKVTQTTDVTFELTVTNGTFSDTDTITITIVNCDDGGTDSDGDGVPDDLDGCPNDANKTDSGECGCGVADTDTDNDGTADCIDECDNDPNKAAPGQCGCGVPDTDTDGDGTPDCTDGCDNDPNKTSPGQCGCGNPDTDTDSDGVADCNDNCPDDPNKTEPGQYGCGLPETSGAGVIVFVSERDGNENIYVMNMDGSNQTRLTSHTATDSCPVVSPDGRFIAFFSNRTGS